MALQNDPRMYSGGSAVFDSSPTVNTYRQIEGERRAKDEALDKYVRELNMKITPTGMRRQEDEVFRDKYAQWMNLGKDRQKLNNPQYRMEFEMRGQELRNLIERSKAEEEAKKPLVPILLDPKKRQELRPEAIGEIDLHDQPLFIKSETGEWIENPNRKRIDISGNLFKSPEFDLPGFRKKVVGEHKPGEIVELDKPVTDKQTGLVYYPAKEKFSKDQIAKMGKDAERFVGESEENKSYYANRLAGISIKEYQALDDVYKKYFGGNIGKSPEKLAAAEAAAEAEQFVGKETMKSKLDYEQRQQDKRINISLSQQPSGGGGVQIITGNEFDRIPIPKKTWLNSGNRVKPEEVPSSTKAILKTAGIDVEGMEYFEIVVDGDKIQAVTPYWKDKEGKLHKEGVITRQDMENAQLKYNTEAQKGQQPVFGDNQNERLPKQIDKTRMNNRRRYKGLDKNGNPIFE